MGYLAVPAVGHGGGAALAPCLRKLVPILRRAEVDPAHSPAAPADFHTGRVGTVIDAVRPIAAKAGRPLRAGLSARELVTNEYVDPSIGLP